MSDVALLTAPTIDEGTRYLSARALDAVFAAITNRINSLIVAMGEARQEDGTFADGIAKWRCFTENAKGAIRELAASMAYLRETSGQAYPSLSVPDGGDYTLIQEGNAEPYFTGLSADPSLTSWTFTIPGTEENGFTARLRIRHTSELTPIGLPSVDLTNPYYPLLRFGATTEPGGIDENRMFGTAPGTIPVPVGVEINNHIASSTTVALVGTYPFSVAQITQTGSVDKKWIANAAINAFEMLPLLDDTDTPILTNLDEEITVSSTTEFGQFIPVTIDETLELPVRGGDVFVISYNVTSGLAAFSACTDYNVDDDENFPYFPRYRDAGGFQFDWLSLRPA